MSPCLAPRHWLVQEGGQSRQAGGGWRTADLVQEEVRLLNLSQGVSEEAEHELLHLEPVHRPQLLTGWERGA